jgi:hypothetical protein
LITLSITLCSNKQGNRLADVADPSDPTVARFYSPLESAIDEAPIGKEGTRGENVEAFVRKRAPKVTLLRWSIVG